MNIKSVVYGGMDGIISTFAVVSGVAGAALDPTIVLILGFSNLFADGISMACGDFLSTRAKKDYEKSHKLAIDDENEQDNAWTTFFAFVLFGLVPLLMYVLSFAVESLAESAFLLSSIFTGFTLILLGVIKGHLSGVSLFRSGLETFIIGALAASVAYGIGYLAAHIIRFVA